MNDRNVINGTAAVMVSPLVAVRPRRTGLRCLRDMSETIIIAAISADAQEEKPERRGVA